MKKFSKVLSLLLVFAMTLTMLPTSALAVVNNYNGGSSWDRELSASIRENAPEQAGDNQGDVITIQKAEQETRLIRLKQTSFFEIVNNKFYVR